MPRVTIGIPVLGGLDPFKLAVKSIFAQTFNDWELIIAVDGTDPSILDASRQIQDKRVVVLFDGKTKGLSRRLNQISLEARGTYIARMDADDVMMPDRISKQLRFLESRPDIDVLGGASVLIDEFNRVRGSYNEPPLPIQPTEFLKSGILSHPTVMYRRSWALKHPYDPSWTRTEDKELWLRTSTESKFGKIPELTLFCRVPAQLSVSKQATTSRFDRKLILKYGKSQQQLPDALRRIAISFCKEVIFRGMICVGLSKLILRKKYSPLPNQVTERLQLTLRQIDSQEVPGW